MKKSLIFIASLTFGTAVSQAAVLCSTTFNRTGTSLDTVTVNTTSDVGLTSSTSISSDDFSKSTSGNDLLASGSIPASVFSPMPMWEAPETIHGAFPSHSPIPVLRTC